MSRGADGMHTAIAPLSHWHPRGWGTLEGQGCTLPHRLDRAATREDHRHVRRLPPRWRRSRAAKRLAGRNVTQDHPGQQTPGVDGVATRTPPARLELVQPLPLEDTASPVRRVDLPTPGTTAPRPVGMPPRADRAQPRGVTPALEPAWEAPFEPNREGCRPGRSPWDALGARAVQLNPQPTWVLEADIAQGGDRLDHDAW